MSPASGQGQPPWDIDLWPLLDKLVHKTVMYEMKQVSFCKPCGNKSSLGETKANTGEESVQEQLGNVTKTALDERWPRAGMSKTARWRDVKLLTSE